MALHEEHFEAAEVLIKAGAVLNLQEEVMADIHDAI